MTPLHRWHAIAVIFILLNLAFVNSLSTPKSKQKVHKRYDCNYDFYWSDSGDGTIGVDGETTYRFEATYDGYLHVSTCIESNDDEEIDTIIRTYDAYDCYDVSNADDDCGTLAELVYEMYEGQTIDINLFEMSGLYFEAKIEFSEDEPEYDSDSWGSDDFDDDDDESNHGLSSGAVAGIISGVVFFLILVTVGILFFKQRKAKDAAAAPIQAAPAQPGQFTPAGPPQPWAPQPGVPSPGNPPYWPQPVPEGPAPSLQGYYVYYAQPGQPGQPYVQPAPYILPYGQPGQPSVQPGQPYVQPGQPYVQPGQPYVQSGQSAAPYAFPQQPQYTQPPPDYQAPDDSKPQASADGYQPATSADGGGYPV